MLAGCREVNSRDISNGKLKLEPIIQLIESLPELPDNQEDLMSLHHDKLGVPWPSDVNYVKMNGDHYKIYVYIKYRTSLWFLSRADGYQNKGWWIDDESGKPPKKVE
jgi:hypothetical protein